MRLPSAGDTLSRRAGPVTHYGTAVAPHRVLDIVPGGPPRVVSLAQFAKGNAVRLRRRPRRDDVPAILARARQAAANDRPYNPVTFNCDHVKNMVLSGRPYSETVIAVSLLLGVGIWVLAHGRGH